MTLTSPGAAATAGVAGSPYAIVPSAAVFGSGSAANYAITYVNGSLTVSKADADCCSISGYSGTYDGAAHGATGYCTGVDG